MLGVYSAKTHVHPPSPSTPWGQILFTSVVNRFSYMTIINIMVSPFFDYLDTLIDGCTKKYVDKLQTLQFRGKKVIYQYSFNGEKITF